MFTVRLVLLSLALASGALAAEHPLRRFKDTATYRPLVRACRFTPQQGSDYYVYTPATLAVLDERETFAGAAIILGRQVVYGAIPRSCLGGKLDGDDLDGEMRGLTVPFETLPGESTIGFLRRSVVPRGEDHFEESVIQAFSVSPSKQRSLLTTLEELAAGPSAPSTQNPPMDFTALTALVKKAEGVAVRSAPGKEIKAIRTEYDQLMASTKISAPAFTQWTDLCRSPGAKWIEQFTLEYMARAFRDERCEDLEKGIWLLSELAKASADRSAPPGLEAHHSLLFLYMLNFGSQDGLLRCAPVLNANHHLIQPMAHLALPPVENPIELGRQRRVDFSKRVLYTREEMDSRGIQWAGGLYPKNLRDSLDHDSATIGNYGRLERALAKRDRIPLFRYTYRWLEPWRSGDLRLQADVFDLIEEWARRGGHAGRQAKKK